MAVIMAYFINIYNLMWCSMNKIIIITGTPGAGKTILAKKLANAYSCWYLDVNEFIKKTGLRERYDKKKRCHIVDEKKLAEKIEGIIKFFRKEKIGLIIDSHLSHYINQKFIDICIVAVCDRKILYNRLKKKGYPENKINDNMECEIMEVCLEEAREFGYGKKIRIVDCSKKMDMEKIRRI